jgi:Tubulin-tyrosine ligase family
LDTVQYVVDRCGYKETSLVGEGNVQWYGLALKDRDVDMIRVRKSYYNRYPLMDHFAKKSILCVILSRLHRFFPQQMSFIPESFMLPDEQYDLEQYMRAYPNMTYIAKPSKGKGGEGISLV